MINLKIQSSRVIKHHAARKSREHQMIFFKHSAQPTPVEPKININNYTRMAKNLFLPITIFKDFLMGIISDFCLPIGVFWNIDSHSFLTPFWTYKCVLVRSCYHGRGLKRWWHRYFNNITMNLTLNSGGN